MTATIRIDILGDSRSGVRAADQTGRAYDRLGRNADRSSARVGGLGSSLGRVAKRYGPLAALAAAGGVLKIGKDSLQAASDVQQAFGAIDAVFGKNAATVKRWAAAAADDVGLAKSEYAQLSTVLGSMLKNTGIENYTGRTRELVKLGADLAAQFGGTTKDAIQSISALLRGELDPIEKYGVSIKQADINARLHAQGLDKLTGSARKQADQQTRLKLLYDQTAAAQGAFGRESDTLAQKQQVLGARWENLKATLGERLLPVATRFLGWLADAVEGSNSAGVAVRKVADVLGSFLAPVLDGAQAGWEHVNDAVNDATGSSHGMHDILVKIGKAAEKYAPIVGEKLGDAIEETGERIGTAITFAEKFWKALKSIGHFADSALGPLDELIGKLGKLDGLGNAIQNTLPGGSLFGLFSSGVALPGGLGRAGGVGAIGGGGGSAIHLTTRPQFNLVVDVPALRAFIRMETQNEISRQVLHAGSTR